MALVFRRERAYLVITHNPSIASTEKKLAGREITYGKYALTFGTRVFDYHIRNHADLRNATEDWSCLIRWYTPCPENGKPGEAAQRVGIQVPRARRNKPSKYERSRARSGQLQCRVG